MRTIQTIWLSGNFAKLGKASITFVMSLRPHGKARFHSTDIHGIWYFRIVSKSAEKIQLFLKSD